MSFTILKEEEFTSFIEKCKEHSFMQTVSMSNLLRVKTTRENGWLALRLKASATGRGLKAYRMVSLQHHLC